MIKLSEIESKYGEYLVDENKLKELLVKPEQKTVWDLENGDIYYSVNSTGSINSYDWRNDQIDREIRKHGHMYLTEEEAKFEAERQECESIMLKYGRRTFKYGEKKYCIESYKKGDIEEIYVACYRDLQNQGSIYFDTEELAKKAINEIGEERLKKYVFRVEE